jgi:hypothetical protein
VDSSESHDAAVRGIRPGHFLPLLLIAAAALVSWWFMPGTKIERAALDLGVRAFANPPFFITEQSGGWQLRTVSSKPRIDPIHLPLLVSLGEDPDGVFQTSSPSPIDLAVIFSNLRRLGADHAASAAVLAWDAPDPIGLVALDQALARFQSIVMAAPLGRRAVAGTMPPAFRNASIELSHIHGDVSQLPLVNHMVLPDAVLGGENSSAGFQYLENDIPPHEFPMLARWDDRVVFAFPMLCLIRQHQVPLGEIEIRPGEFIRLGRDGPVLPLDSRGRLAARLASPPATIAIPAASTIDAPDDMWSAMDNRFPILRDDRSPLEPATRSFSAAFPTVIALIASDTALAAPQIIRRNSTALDLTLLALCAVLLAAAVGLPDFPQALAFVTITAILCITTLIETANGHWPPILPALAAVLTAVMISRTPLARHFTHRA